MVFILFLFTVHQIRGGDELIVNGLIFLVIVQIRDAEDEHLRSGRGVYRQPV